MMVELTSQIYRDFNTDGDPGSGAHKPEKTDIRAWGEWVEQRVNGGFDANIEIEKSYPRTILNKTAHGEQAEISGQLNGLDRWSIIPGDITEELGGDSGSDLLFIPYDDAGTIKPDLLIRVSRATGKMTIGSGQIQFPATQNPSADANTLDDYEEGTWTPTLSATGCTFSYASQVGTYTKIGNRCLIDFRVQLNTSGNTLAANPLSLTGLPFAASALAAALVYPVSWSASTTSYVSLNALLAGGDSSVTFGGSTAAAVTNVTAQNANGVLHATNGSVVRGSFQFRTT